MPRKRAIGPCCICGAEGPLSFEHVPPRAAFNNRPMLLYRLQQVMGTHPEHLPKGRTSQRGAGAYTLCERCNNLTGRWYGRWFVEWVYQGMNFMAAGRGQDPLVYVPFHILPLRVIKQVVCMFFSCNGDGFQRKQPELVRFVLDKHHRHIPPQFRIYAFYNLTDRPRKSGIAGQLSVFGHQNVFSEVAFPPIGYVMTLDSPPPDKRLADITYFADYGYDDYRAIPLRMPVLPVYSWYPADYRDKETYLRGWENPDSA